MHTCQLCTLPYLIRLCCCCRRWWKACCCCCCWIICCCFFWARRVTWASLDHCSGSTDPGVGPGEGMGPIWGVTCCGGTDGAGAGWLGLIIWGGWKNNRHVITMINRRELITQMPLCLHSLLRVFMFNSMETTLPTALQYSFDSPHKPYLKDYSTTSLSFGCLFPTNYSNLHILT